MTNGRKMNVTVLLGGDSPERAVSLSSGRGIIEALRRRNHRVFSLDPAVPVEEQREPDITSIGREPPGRISKLPGAKIFEWLSSRQILDADVVFIALHGGAGE
ncbi:MAG: D-alanine--D-alanine ligase, partial [Candidatus Krumholzibacteriota bacterium]|nr:D-alanine--D-alanine ligase [Candidatus Krumholzibacteriota bacterium]